MKLDLPGKEKVSKKRLTVYIVIIAICILAIIVVVGVQVLGNDVVDNMFGINKLSKRTEQEEANLKTNFEGLFKNQFENIDEYETNKIESDREIVYTEYSRNDKTDNYEINVNVPVINIKNRDIQSFNEEIRNTYENKAEDVIKNHENKTIYTVKYLSYIKNNILSVVIYSDLKQDLNAQRVIIQTFNFNLEEKEEMTLNDAIKIYSLDKNEVQNKINKDIKTQQDKANELIKLGYNVFSRDINSDIYKVDNVKEYFIYNDNIYIVFAYGNDKITSEKDIVIL